ncbi:hypothetical protein LZZ85_12655 [Terrimonas sp. NA20]|uniref:Uncharacterized protein n=1 Tax=Terrimonas ginsenosidimutans TaxID=2908004 RepID=A0ABS9KS37_9BACT|nr:hypothetical protein [Terrimonas ginsenosidimutans]MCG2615142.1 hypothetical protein [Terrimonas ginsenosidimutans]
MQALPFQIKITIICVTKGRRKYQFRYRTDRFFDGLATDIDGPSYGFSLVNSQDHWAFDPEASLPQWLVERESEVVSLFSLTLPNASVTGYNN